MSIDFLFLINKEAIDDCSEKRVRGMIGADCYGMDSEC